MAKFTMYSNYKEACENTDDGLVPLAVIMHTLPSFTLPDDKPFHPDSESRALLAMTTVYNNPEENGTWGWYILEADIKIKIGKIMLEHVPQDEWVYFGQTYEGGEFPPEPGTGE